MLLASPPRPHGRWALCAEGTATLGGLLHLLSKGGPVAALKGDLPPLQPQALAAALARARAPALHPRQRARGLADGIAPLDLVKVPDRVPPALGLWMGQTPRENLRAQPWARAAPWEAEGGGESGGGERQERGGERERGQPPGMGPPARRAPSPGLPAHHAHAQPPPGPSAVRGEEGLLAARACSTDWAARLPWRGEAGGLGGSNVGEGVCAGGCGLGDPQVRSPGSLETPPPCSPLHSSRHIEVRGA